MIERKPTPSTVGALFAATDRPGEGAARRWPSIFARLNRPSVVPDPERDVPRQKLWQAETPGARRQAMAEQPDFQRINPAQAALWRDQGYQSYGETDPATTLGRSLRDILSSPGAQSIQRGFAQLFNHGVVPGAVAGGTGLGLLGGAAGLGLNALGGSGWGRRLGWGGLLLGALLGGLAGHYRSQNPGTPKAASFKRSFGFNDDTSDPLPTIRERLLADPTISPDTQGTLLELVAQLSMNQLQRLRSMLGAVVGAGAGALVARFLMGAGLLGTLAGAIGGGWLGNRFASGSGSSTLAGNGAGDRQDLYGNRFYL